MKYLVFFLAIIPTLVGEAINSNDTKIQGRWVDQESEFIKIEILKIESETYLKAGSDIAQITYQNNGVFLNFNNKLSEIKYLPKEDRLIIGENVFIRNSDSVSNKFRGAWYGEENNIMFVFFGGIESTCLIWNTSEKLNLKTNSNTYYPKFKDGKFRVTYNNKLFILSQKGSELKDNFDNIYKNVR